jgi:hypothetical protein
MIDIGGIVDNHCLNIFCCCCWYSCNCWQSLFKHSFLFVDIGGIVDNHNINKQKRMFKQWLSTIPPISTNKKECLNNDCQQFLQYQQTKNNV